MKIAIIGGSGKMGQWFARFLLKEGKEVVITGRNKDRLLEVRRQLGIETAGNAEAVKNADVILISVPIDSFEEVIAEIGPYTHSGQTIMDITSIKKSPVEAMHRYIKRGVVLGMHPMFGPGAKDIANQSFILTPTREEEEALAQKVEKYLVTRGAKITRMSPDEHDEMMTIILGLSHFIAIVSADTLLSFGRLKKMRTISGNTYKVLLALAEGVVSEDPEFYASLQMSLPNMAEVEREFQTKVKRWEEIVRSKDRSKFADGMRTLRKKLEQSGLDFWKGYDNMYRIVERLER